MKNQSKMSRVEHIREESKKALEFGQSAGSDIPLAENFRVEGLAAIPFSQNPNLLPHVEATLFPKGNRQGILAVSNPFRRLQKPELLVDLIEAQIANLDGSNSAEDTNQLTGLFSDLSAQTTEYKNIEKLHRKMLTSVFGKDYFTNGGAAKARNSVKRD